MRLLRKSELCERKEGEARTLKTQTGQRRKKKRSYQGNGDRMSRAVRGKE